MESTEMPSYGRSIISWDTWEGNKHDRSIWWYVIAGAIGVALLLYAILTASFPFAVIVLMVGIITLMSHLRDPEQITVHITTSGILVGRHFYGWKEIKNFSIVYNPPRVKLLYLDFQSRWIPLTSVPLDDMDPNEVRDAIKPYAVENLQRDEESLTDFLNRVYKL
jgi:hypothetical protein